MNTEDDTFRKLRQIPFDDLRAIIANLPYSHIYALRDNHEEREKYLNLYGWTYDEYNIALNSGYKLLPVAR